MSNLPSPDPIAYFLTRNRRNDEPEEMSVGEQIRLQCEAERKQWKENRDNEQYQKELARLAELRKA